MHNEIRNRLRTGVVGLRRRSESRERVRTGAHAEAEWTWESPSEPFSKKGVGMDGTGAVIVAQGMKARLSEPVCLREVFRPEAAG